MIKPLKKFVKNLKIEKLFYSNKFVAVFSVVSSFALWILVSSSSAESVSVTISDIPVDISLSESAVQDGLRVFSGQDITARVEVSGSRMVVGQLTKNNIQITSSQSSNTIMSPGNYTLELSAKKVGLLNDYEIVSDVKPSFVTVMVDRYREAEYDIEPQIDFNAKEGYFVGNTIVSEPKVKISGPETEISKIKKVVVRGNISGEINETTNLKLPIILCDAYGQSINSETIKTDFSEVQVSVPILMRKDIKVEPNFSNVPSGINLSKNEYKDLIKINPSKLEIAGPENIVSEMSKVLLQTIDFTTLNTQNRKFELPIILPQGCRSLNNIYNAQIEVNMSLFKEKTLNINRFSFKGIPASKSAKVYNDSINVKFIGSPKSVNALKPSDVVAQIDLTGKEENLNSMELPINFIISGFEDVWVSETYFANVVLNDIKN